MTINRSAKMFLSSALAGLVVTTAGTVQAGKWSVAGPTHAVNTESRQSPLPDTYPHGVSSRTQIGQQLIDIWDGSNTGRSYALNCISFWNAEGITCSPAVEGSRPHVGAWTLVPQRTWFVGGVQHGWIPADDFHFAYADIHWLDPGQVIKGVTYYW